LIFGEGARPLLTLPESRPGALDLSPDGAWLFYAGTSQGGRPQIRCVDARSGEDRWRAPAASEYLSALRCSPDGTRVAASGYQGTISVLDAESGQIVGAHQVADRAPRGGLCWSPDGSRVLSLHGHGRAQVALLDAEGVLVDEPTLPFEARSASFVGPNRVALGGGHCHVCVVDLTTGEVASTFEWLDFVIGIAADGRHVAAAYDHGLLALRALDEGEALPALEAANEAAYRERVARNELRVRKTRSLSRRHTLDWELSAARGARGKALPGRWRGWVSIPHGQVHNLRFVPAGLLLCDGRDASLWGPAPAPVERLLVGVYPMPGEPPYLHDVACAGGLAAVGVRSGNARLASHVLVLALEG
jgi:hypothetical protein